MNTRFKEAHRREYYPDTASDKLFKAQQPEYVQPTNQLSATFIKVDFTLGQTQNRLDEITYRAKKDYSDMTAFEQEELDKITQFRKDTEDRAQKIRKQQFQDEKNRLEQVMIKIILKLKIQAGICKNYLFYLGN